MSVDRAVANVEVTLSALRDIAGVYGSFFLSPSGNLVTKDLPRVYDEALFADIGPRIVRLQETLASAGDGLDTCLLRFDDIRLFLLPSLHGSLGVLFSPSADLKAVKMSVRLAARRISAELTGMGDIPPPSARRRA
jgi:predicted regulator of Ras-like GTPase activity (Roadblock/LC7/MglB family)